MLSNLVIVSRKQRDFIIPPPKKKNKHVKNSPSVGIVLYAKLLNEKIYEHFSLKFFQLFVTCNCSWSYAKSQRLISYCEKNVNAFYTFWVFSIKCEPPHQSLYCHELCRTACKLSGQPSVIVPYWYMPPNAFCISMAAGIQAF